MGQHQPGNIWVLDIVERIASFLSSNDVACILRLVDKTTWLQFRHYTPSLSHPCSTPVFAARWGTPGALCPLSFKQRRQLLTLTATSGNVPNLKVAFQAIAASLTDEALHPDDLAPGELCPWLEAHGCWWLDEVLAAAAGAGHQAMCEWLLDCGCPCDTRAVYAAARGGHPGLMKRLLLLRPDLRFDLLTYQLLLAAAEGCELADLQDLHAEWIGHVEEEQEHDEDSILVGSDYMSLASAAAGSRTPDWQVKVEWLEELSYRLGRRRGQGSRLPCRGAATAGPDAVARLEWLQSRGHPLTTEALADAARTGNVDAVRYLLGKVTFGWEHRHAGAAASAGHLAVLQVLHSAAQLGHPSHPLTCAASCGRLEVVAWLMDQFRLAPEDVPGILAAALRSGSGALVRWLVGRGCRLDPGSVADAVIGGCAELVEWLVVEQGCAYPGGGELYMRAITHRDMATLRCLGRLRVPMEGGERVYNHAVARGGLVALRCLHEQLRYPWSPTAETLTEWVRQRYPLAVVQWLVEEARCPVDWSAALAEANKHRILIHDPVSDWLLVERLRQGLAPVSGAAAGPTLRASLKLTIERWVERLKGRRSHQP